mmetsp:Transcript_11799/g.27091  ORF Transcript_11799/g.27091 Transcript_11799/m.27091 type:complete len:107 (+) Transcript_11799:290-610(+)
MGFACVHGRYGVLVETSNLTVTETVASNAEMAIETSSADRVSLLLHDHPRPSAHHLGSTCHGRRGRCFVPDRDHPDRLCLLGPLLDRRRRHLPSCRRRRRRRESGR